MNHLPTVASLGRGEQGPESTAYLLANAQCSRGPASLIGKFCPILRALGPVHPQPKQTSPLTSAALIQGS